MLLTGYSGHGGGFGANWPAPVLKRPQPQKSSTSTPPSSPSGSVPEFDGASVIAVVGLMVAVLFVAKSRLSERHSSRA